MRQPAIHSPNRLRLMDLSCLISSPTHTRPQAMLPGMLLNLGEATLRGLTKQDLNPGFPTDWLCDLRVSCLTSLCLQLLLYHVKEIIILPLRAAVESEGGNIWGALSTWPAWSFLSLNNSAILGWTLLRGGGLSHAWREAEQHPWTLPTRCQ